jgi:hypothetical protein
MWYRCGQIYTETMGNTYQWGESKIGVVGEEKQTVVPLHMPAPSVSPTITCPSPSPNNDDEPMTPS